MAVKSKGKKKYSTTVYTGTVNGKKQRKHLTADTPSELRQKVRNLKIDIDNGKDVKKALFGEWADKWLNEYKIPSGIGNGTITQYKSAIVHLKREYEFVEFKNIKLSDFQIFINKLAEENPTTHKPTSKATLQSVIKVASAICLYASANDVAGVPMFFKAVKVPKGAPTKQRRALTETEQQMIIDTPNRCQPAAMILLFSGIRRGELIPLKWSDIDLENGFIDINKSVEFKNNTPTVKEGGKSAAAVRLVPIPPILIDYLKRYKKDCKILSSYVCSNAAGKMHTKTSFRKMWNSYLIDLNVKYGYAGQDVSKYNPEGLPMKIEPFTPHYLRHTYATMLFLQNVDVVSAKQYLGHSNIQVTIDIYTDLKNNNRINLSEKYKHKLQNEYKIISA